MLSQEIYKIFLDISGRYGDPNMEYDEFARTWNFSQLAVLRDNFYNIPKSNSALQPQVQYAFEMNKNMAEKWQVLIKPISATSNAQGVITMAQITPAGRELFGVNYLMKNSKRVKYIRHNDISMHLDNHFLKPTSERPAYLYFDNNIKLYPEEVQTIVGSVTVYPLPMAEDLTGSVEISRQAVYDVLMRVLAFYGISVREADLYNKIENEAVK